jgi:hypothetical protein
MCVYSKTSVVKHDVDQFGDGSEIQSLSFHTAEGFVAELGVLIPGTTAEFNFGKSAYRETLRVVSGTIILNGMAVGPKDPPVVIEIGQEMKFRCTEPTAYFSTYED